MKDMKNKNIIGKHIPIMINEVIEGLDIKTDDIVIDCTTNRGGHSKEILSKLGSDGTLICIDLDTEALKEAKECIESEEMSEDKNVHYINDNFANIQKILEELSITKVDKIFADLGISSQELDISGRGFTFQKDEPLLMTFASSVTDDTVTARDIVNDWSEEVIADILYNFADETFARRIASKIIEYRKTKSIDTTSQLVSIIKEASPQAYHNRKTHFATRTFQALRMATNGEIDNIIKLIESSSKILVNGGRLVFITFHSIEDRIVKKKTKELGFKLLTKRPIEPSRAEVISNPRSRSAKLRIYEYNI